MINLPATIIPSLTLLAFANTAPKPSPLVRNLTNACLKNFYRKNIHIISLSWNINFVIINNGFKGRTTRKNTFSITPFISLL